MNFEDYEKLMIKFIDQYKKIFDELTLQDRKNLFQIIMKGIEDLDKLTKNEFEKLLSDISSVYDKLKKVFESFTIQTIPAMFNLTQKLNIELLKLFFANVKSYDRDVKAVSVLIRDMLQDFNIACGLGLESIQTFFKISKQLQLAESDISRLTAQGVLEKGTTYQVKKLLRGELKQQILDENKFEDYLARRIAKYQSELKKLGTSEKTIENKLKKFVDKLEQEKYLQIVDKNGKIRTYSIKSYTDLVARTRLGEAQVISTIEFGYNNDIKHFQVTGHNTSTKICIPHEWKIYTIDKNDRRYEFLTSDKRPLYHPNCQHRLIPRAIL